MVPHVTIILQRWVCLQIVGMWSTEYPVESQGHWTFLQEGPPWTTTAS